MISEYVALQSMYNSFCVVSAYKLEHFRKIYNKNQ